MASVSGAASSLGNTSLRGYGGFGSGIDRDSIIEQMTAGTQSKITNQKNKMTSLGWKQEAFQAVSDKMLALQDNYFSFASGTNLKYPSMFAKNQITAIRAMKTLIEHQPKAKLLLAGNGPTLPELQAEVTALELQGYVEFLGYRTDLERYANIADVIVSCSYREGLPMNIVEGMLLGKPVVASYNRGHRELIVPEKTGYMVPPADSDAFAEKIAVLLNDGELAGRMGQAGYEKAQLYADTNVRRELQAVYEL